TDGGDARDLDACRIRSRSQRLQSARVAMVRGARLFNAIGELAFEHNLHRSSCGIVSAGYSARSLAMATDTADCLALGYGTFSRCRRRLEVEWSTRTANHHDCCDVGSLKKSPIG